MEHAKKSRTLVIVVDVPEDQGMDVVKMVGSIIGGPGIHFRQAYFDDAPENAPRTRFQPPRGFDADAQDYQPT